MLPVSILQSVMGTVVEHDYPPNRSKAKNNDRNAKPINNFHVGSECPINFVMAGVVSILHECQTLLFIL